MGSWASWVHWCESHLSAFRRPTAAASARSRSCRPSASFAAGRAAALEAGRQLGDVFSFVSGLYFRGKLTYARAVRGAARARRSRIGSRRAHHHAQRRPARARHAHHARAPCSAFAGGEVDPANASYRRPLEQSARALAAEIGPDCDVVLLGSVASPKYVDVLAGIFGERLRFPIDFVGRGDMSRGGLLLRKAQRRGGAGVRAGGRRRPARQRGRRSCRACESSPRLTIPRVTTRQRRADRRPQGSPPHQSAQSLLARARPDQGRPPSVLRRRRRRAAAASPRSRDGDEALPARRRGPVLLHEARADAAARLDRDLLDRAWLGQRHRFPDDPGSCRAALGRQPRLHRSESVVRALRRCRSARLSALRSRSGRGRHLRPRARDRAASCATRSRR